MGGRERYERMAVMEAAISSSLSHPNIVQTFTFGVECVEGAKARSLAMRLAGWVVVRGWVRADAVAATLEGLRQHICRHRGGNIADEVALGVVMVVMVACGDDGHPAMRIEVSADAL